MRLKNSILNPVFKNIYIEKDAFDYEITKDILKKHNKSKIIEIAHYKDVFNDKNRNFSIEKKTFSLILGVNKSKKIYKGSEFCNDYGYDYFYYLSFMKNCIYNCEYCYLKGMYNTGNILVFVNYMDYIKQIKKIKRKEKNI